MRSFRWWTIIGVASLLLVGWSGSALAQDEGGSDDSAGASDGAKDSAKDDNAAPKVKVERGAGGKKVYRITTGFVIEGRIQKPNAFYVLERSQINYDWAALKKDFLPRILDSVKKHPF